MTSPELAASPTLPAPKRDDPAPNRTMLGLPGSQDALRAAAALRGASTPAETPPAPSPLRAPEASERGPEKPRPIPQKTMMGMSSPFAGLQTPPHGQPPLGDAHKPAAASPAGAPPAGSPLANTVVANTVARSGAGQAAEVNKRTVMGVAPPDDVVQAIREANASLQGRPLESPAAATAPKSPPAAAPGKTSGAPLNKTMLGMAAPNLSALAQSASADKPAVAPLAASTATTPMAQPIAPPAPAVTPESKVSAKSDRTMLGLPGAVPSDFPEPEAGRISDLGRVSVTPPSPDDKLQYSFTTPSTDELDARISVAPPGPRGSSMRALFAALAGALVVLGLGATLWHFFAAGDELNVRVVQSEEGEALEVQVPRAAPGEKVRFLGVEQGLQGGVARFPLAANALSLGDNELAIGLVQGTDVESTTVRLHVAYRARVDLSGLAHEPATLEVLIDALPGAKVSVDGKPLALDAKGHGALRYPIAAQTGAKLPFSARYKIEPLDGAVSEGTLALNLPVASLQIDRPGPNVTTDQNNVEVAGAVENAAMVTVDGAPVKVNEGRFLYKVKLPKPGDYVVHVLAQVAGKVPRTTDLNVTRVADLTLAAASFTPDSSLTYARIAQNPVIYRGQNVSFDGRVYNVEVKGGASHLQMLVRDCPGAQRCPLWVELPQATDATVDTWVRVLGTVAGEQQFRSERGQVHTVPSVKAQYVLKLAR